MRNYQHMNSDHQSFEFAKYIQRRKGEQVVNLIKESRVKLGLPLLDPVMIMTMK